jgi:hypothetical protein
LLGTSGKQNKQKVKGTIMKNRTIISKFTNHVLIAAALSLSLANASAQVSLTDVVVFGASSTGNWFGQPDVFVTRSNSNFNVWIQSGASGGPFLNGPSNNLAQPNISLSSGLTTFRLLADPGADNGYFGINLFFNGSSTPSISAYGPMMTGPGSHSFSADSAQNTPMPFPGADSGYTFPGAGTLSFVSGSQLITLTDFYWAKQSVNNLDLVGQYSTGADGATDYVGGITLSVTSVPEPHLSLWAFGCLAGMMVYRNRKTRAAQKC